MRMSASMKKRSIFHIPSIFIFIILVLAPIDLATAGQRSHGLSAFGKLKYSPDFKHFDYVNPSAPKGGRISMIGTAGLVTFDSLNGYILKGDPAQGLGRTTDTLTVFDQLMVRAWDEPSSVYGLVAESAEVADDRKSVVFYLRNAARFSDGTRLTAEDVKFSFDILKDKGHPAYSIRLRDVVRAEVLAPDKIRYDFQGEAVRDLLLAVAELPIFSKAFYASRKFEETSLEPPIGSGPYKIGDFKTGRYITYVRRDDYWARDLPVSKGKYNFDELRYEYYRDRSIELEALKGQSYDLREEFTSRDWATAYDVPAVHEKRLIRRVLEDKRPSGAQGFFINIRRNKFKDIRVRQALDLAFDFEWTNKNIFYDHYKRTASYFENSDMKATGAPVGKELELLQRFRDKLPKSVFEGVYTPPVSNGSGQDRKNLRAASKLLSAAGWTVRGGKRFNAKGEELKIEFLIYSPSFERVIAPYVKNLKLIGVDASIRRVDPAQYQRRVKGFEFDITTQRFVMRLTPGIELRNILGSKAADAVGSYNLAGVKDPVIDALIEEVISAGSRDDMVAAARALDRVLRAGHYWVPHWYKASHTVAYWDKFSEPKIRTPYNRGIIETWWYDNEKAARLEKK